MAKMFTTLNALLKYPEVKGVMGAPPPANATAIMRTSGNFTYFYSGDTYVAHKKDSMTHFVADSRSAIERFIEEMGKEGDKPNFLADYGAPAINYCELKISGWMNPTVTVVSEGVDRTAWERGKTLSAVQRQEEYAAGWTLVHYNEKDNTFLAHNAGKALVKCQVTGKDVPMSRTMKFNINNAEVTISTAEATRLGLAHTVGREGANSMFDAYFQTVMVDGKPYAQEYIKSHADEFATSSVSKVLLHKPSAIAVATGEFMTPSEFKEHGFVCQVSGENHLYANNPKYGKRERVADVHYKPKLEAVIKEYAADPMDYYGHIRADGTFGEGKIPEHVSRTARDGKKRTVPNTDMYLAMEIEVYGDTTYASGAAASDIMDAKLGLCCKDTSLPPNGFEIKTVPQVGGISAKRMADITEVLAKYKIKANDKCGIHIHVSREPLSELQIDRIASFMYKHGNGKFIETIAGRPSTSKYCRYDSAKHKACYNVPGNGRRKIVKTNKDHYWALNLNKRPTIEFRIFSGSTDLNKLKMYQEFVLAMVEFTSPGNYNFPANYAATERDFLQFIFDRNRPGRKMYPNLYSFLIAEGRVASRSSPKQFA